MQHVYCVPIFSNKLIVFHTLAATDPVHKAGHIRIQSSGEKTTFPTRLWYVPERRRGNHYIMSTEMAVFLEAKCYNFHSDYYFFKCTGGSIIIIVPKKFRKRRFVKTWNWKKLNLLLYFMCTSKNYFVNVILKFKFIWLDVGWGGYPGPGQLRPLQWPTRHPLRRSCRTKGQLPSNISITYIWTITPDPGL